MANPYDQFLQEAASGASPKANPYEQFITERAAASSGELRGDPMLDRAMRTVGDAVRAFGDTASFGTADRIMGGNEVDLTRFARQRSPRATLAGDIAGTILPTGIFSQGLGKFIGALGRNTVPSITGNQALTGGIGSIAQDVGHGDAPDPAKAGAVGLVSGVLGPVIAKTSQYFSPAARARAAGSNLTDADKASMGRLAEEASDRGIPLSIPELARATAPGRSGAVEAAYNTAAASPRGSQVVADFNSARTPAVEQSARDLASRLGPSATGLDVSRSASDAIRSAQELVENSVAGIKPGGKFVKTPTDDVAGVAMNRMESDPLKASLNQGLKTNAPAFLTRLHAEMMGMLKNAKGRGDWTAPHIENKVNQLQNDLEAANPNIRIARETREAGSEMVAELDRGSLGRMSRSRDPVAQSNELFGVTTTPEADDAIRTATRLGPDTSRALLATRISDAANRNPLGFGRTAIPNSESERVAGIAAGGLADDVSSTMRVARAVDPSGPSPHTSESRSGPWGEMWSGIRNYGSPSLIRKMNDSNFVDQLGKIGLAQQLGLAAGTGATELAGDANVPLVLRVTRRRNRR